MINLELLDIYEWVADKRPQEGCYIFSDKPRNEQYHNWLWIIYKVGETYWGRFDKIPNIWPCYWSTSVPDENYWHKVWFSDWELAKFKIIGRQIMLWDILDWWFNLPKRESPEFDKIIRLYTKKRDPIELQPPELHTFIRSLITQYVHS